VTDTDHTPRPGPENPSETGKHPGRRRKYDAARKAEIEQRREQVATLLLARVPYRQMAELLGVSKSQIAEDVAVIKRAHRERAAASYDVYVTEMTVELDGLMRAWMPVAMNPGNATDESLDGAEKAARVVLRIMERRSRLMGLDAPVRAELTGEGGGPIRFEGLTEAQAVANQAVAQFVLRRSQQLEAERAALAAGETRGGDPDDGSGAAVVAGPSPRSGGPGDVIEVTGTEHG
jgi:hypothetical protein